MQDHEAIAVAPSDAGADYGGRAHEMEALAAAETLPRRRQIYVDAAARFRELATRFAARTPRPTAED
jgi:hypothetical protein